MTLLTKGMGVVLKKIFKPKPKTSPTITSIKPNKSDKMSKHKVDLAKIPGATANRWKKSMDDLDETGKVVRKFTQRLKKEKPTESGVSKGKDLKD
jgi:16S rRNA A1518/A1519 N6-dimethyltransferase RsmA/KsgA/DIM1 with predicted DNA glycosylase/AP lyase activity